MKVYLAGRYGRREEFRSYIPIFEAAGFEVNSRWLTKEYSDEVVAAVESGNISRQEGLVCCFDDYNDITACSVLVVFTEHPNVEGKARGGRHVEFGIALSMHKRLVRIGPMENIFHCIVGPHWSFRSWSPKIPGVIQRNLEKSVK